MQLIKELSELRAWKKEALEAMRLQDEAQERIMAALPARYLGWYIWEAAADFIEKARKLCN